MDEKGNRAESRPKPQLPNPRDGRDPGPQGLKAPPKIEPGEESGEWTRGGGTDPNESGP